jgi:hypothetical protein
MTHLPLAIIFLFAAIAVGFGWFFIDVVGPQPLTQWWRN